MVISDDLLPGDVVHWVSEEGCNRRHAVEELRVAAVSPDGRFFMTTGNVPRVFCADDVERLHRNRDFGVFLTRHYAQHENDPRCLWATGKVFGK